MSQNDKTFLILTGALTALGLPFALAFPPAFIDKALAIAGLIAVAAFIAAAIQAIRKKN